MWAFLKRLFSIYLRPYRRRELALLGCIVVAVAFDTIFPLGTKFIIDLAIAPRDTAVFVRLVAGLALLYVIATFSNPTLDYLMIWLTTQVLNNLRHRMFSHLQVLSAGTHQRLQAGEVLTRFGNDLSTIERGMYYAVAPGIQQILTLVVGAVVLFQLDWRLALLTGVLLPLPVILPRRTIAAATETTYRRKATDSSLTGMVQETLAAQATTRAFGLGDHALAAFDARLATYAPEAVKADFLSWLGYRITGASQYFIQFLVIAIGGYLALRGQMSVGSLVGFTALLYNLGVALTDFSSTMALLIPAAASSDRIEGLLSEPVTIVEQPGAPALPAFRHTIAFDHVTFGYAGPENPQLHDVSFSLTPANRWPSSGAAGRARVLCSTCCSVTTTRRAAAYCWTTATSGRSRRLRYAGKWGSSPRTISCSTRASARTSASAGQRLRTRRLSRLRGRRAFTTSSPAFLRATTPSSASAAGSFRVASGSASRWPGPLCAGRQSSCSTRQPRPWIRRARLPFTARSRSCAVAAPSCASLIASRLSPTWTISW